MVYLNEFNLSNNNINVIPECICDCLSLNDGLEGVNFSNNPISNVDELIWKYGIKN
jgi:hypothetical protein